MWIKVCGITAEHYGGTAAAGHPLPALAGVDRRARDRVRRPVKQEERHALFG
ncbi:hypothetical protein [Streptomyces sp. WAC 06738]|uniref:hypothetical protein n=1 Tax=Streptomyces sp. WAC 06738 TaxID=2203210 RepID=UPI0013E0AD33|nr:hypothetical protein [Streptomyces sp. WAC 06738]